MHQFRRNNIIFAKKIKYQEFFFIIQKIITSLSTWKNLIKRIQISLILILFDDIVLRHRIKFRRSIKRLFKMTIRISRIILDAIIDFFQHSIQSSWTKISSQLQFTMISVFDFFTQLKFFHYESTNAFNYNQSNYLTHRSLHMLNYLRNLKIWRIKWLNWNEKWIIHWSI